MYVTDKMMRGNSRLRQALAAYLAEQVPHAIDIARSQWGLLAYQLPYPTTYDTYDPYSNVDYPNMGSYFTGSSTFIQQDVADSAARTYDGVYEGTLFVTAQTAYISSDESGIDQWEEPYRDSAIRQRDDLMAILRQCILNGPSLGTAGTDERVLLLEETIRESYPAPIKVGDDRNPRWVCSGLINANFRMSESTVVPHFGPAKTVRAIIDKNL